MSIPTYRDLNIEQVTYTSPTLINRRHIAVAKNEDKSEVLFDTPPLEVKNGFCVSEDRCYLELILKRRDSKFYNFLVDIGDSGITTTFKQSRNWFGNEMPFDIVDDYHRSVVKLSRDKGVATMKCKVPYSSKRDRISVKIYNQEGTQFKQSDIQDGTFVVARLRYNGLRFLKQMFTEEYEVVRLTVQEKTTDESLDNKYSTGGYDFGFEQYDTMTVDDNNDDLLKEYESEPEADQVETVEEEEVQAEAEAEEDVQVETDKVQVETDTNETQGDEQPTEEVSVVDEAQVEDTQNEIEVEVEKVLEEERKERHERRRRRRRRKEKKPKSEKTHKRVLMLSGGRTREL